MEVVGRGKSNGSTVFDAWTAHWPSVAEQLSPVTGIPRFGKDRRNGPCRMEVCTWRYTQGGIAQSAPNFNFPELPLGTDNSGATLAMRHPELDDDDATLDPSITSKFLIIATAAAGRTLRGLKRRYLVGETVQNRKPGVAAG
ncbi:uncharacterized protein B0T23DRAFT_234432 [Neurospora hispaniola]|uniref:Uncharacterized protein n=1 Tax=Neurospora hispaniola TaxID=588809 RepID=A0AAJ0I1F9_9PEZI|nr:hypothetical protein B0T23DRAFT_234432 [Neurospora hispaniola]